MKKSAIILIIWTLVWASMASAVPAVAAPTDQLRSANIESLTSDSQEQSRKGWLNIAAATMGMESRAMWQELAKGKTIAQIAEAMGLEGQLIVDAIVAAETETINKQVEEVQEQATQFVMNVPNDTAGDEQPELPVEGGPDDHEKEPDIAEPADDADDNVADGDGTDKFDYLDILPAEDDVPFAFDLWIDLNDEWGLDDRFSFDQDINFDFAFSHGDGVNYIHIGITKTAGLSEAHAISWKVPGWGYHVPSGYDNNTAWLSMSAEVIGVEIREIAYAWHQGKSIASVAEANDVDPNAVVDALVIDTEEMADLKLEMLPEAAENFVNHTFGQPWSHEDSDEPVDENDTEDPDRLDDDWFEDEEWFEDETGENDETPDLTVIAVDWYEAAANALNMAVDDLLAQIEQGQSIAEIADEAGIDLQSIGDAIIAAEKAVMEQVVADGLLEPEDVAEWLEDVKEAVKEFIDRHNEEIFEDDIIDDTFLDDVDWLSAILESTGVNIEMLWSELLAGRSLSEILRDANIDRQDVIQTIVDHEREIIARIVRLGLITQDDADKWLAAIEEIAIDFLDDSLVNADADNEGIVAEDAAAIVSQAAATSLTIRKDMAAKSLMVDSTTQAQEFDIFIPVSVQMD